MAWTMETTLAGQIDLRVLTATPTRIDLVSLLGVLWLSCFLACDIPCERSFCGVADGITAGDRLGHVSSLDGLNRHMDGEGVIVDRVIGKGGFGGELKVLETGAKTVG